MSFGFKYYQSKNLNLRHSCKICRLLDSDSLPSSLWDTPKVTEIKLVWKYIWLTIVNISIQRRIHDLLYDWAFHENS